MIVLKKFYSEGSLFLFLFSCFILFSTSKVSAQQSDSTLVDSLTLSPSIIDRIIITGNYKTKEYIILRELLFHDGDTLPPFVLESTLNKSRENLMNIGLFNFVDIHYFRSFQNRVDIHIELIERWYIWPVPVFELADRNFNEWWQKRDLSRTNYGAYIRQDNFRGRDETIKLQLVLGYSQRLGLYYNIPYINRKQNLGLTFGISATRNEEVNYNTVENKIVFYKDKGTTVRNDMQSYLTLTKRNGLYQYYNTTLEYRNTNVVDTIIDLNNNFFIDPYPRQQQISLSWSYRLDKRDYQSYALRGYMFQLDVSKIGMGLLPHEPDLMSIAANVRYYRPVSSRFYTGISVKGRVMQRESGPYFNQRALGYLFDYIRGYEYYVMNGQDFVLLHTNLKFALLPTKVYALPVIGSEKFKKVPIAIYLNAFYDGGIVSDQKFSENNPLSNTYQNGYGIGLDYVTYYDLVFRFEYAWNKMGENGLFFHIGAAF